MRQIAISSSSRKVPGFIKPMLAKETNASFDDPDWIFEVKWDGFRAIADLRSDVKLYSRNGNDFSGKYPPIAAALRKLKKGLVLDGEIVVLDDNGLPSFQKLQHYEQYKHLPLLFYVFDLLEKNGRKITDLPLTQRKALLKKLIPKTGSIRYADHVEGNGLDFFRIAVQKDLEGIMAKRASSTYAEGARTTDWLKVKNHKSAEALIVGFTKPTGSRKYFGSLVLAARDGKDLRHLGQAGTGYNDATLTEIFNKLQPLVRAASPFDGKVDVPAGVTWVEPVLICEVKFSEWTKDRKFRHPVFLRLRNDKQVKEIDMKNIAPITKLPKKQATSVNNKVVKKQKKGEEEIKIGKATVKLTNLSKVYWPDEGITKGMLIDYYQSIAPYILPFLKDRPQSLKRNPNGIKDGGFFHKDAGEEAPPFVKSFKVYAESSKKEIDYIICNDAATLAYLNNLGCIELNPWHSTTKKPEYPDYMIIDIDPSEKNTFDQVVETANAFKKVLDDAGASCYCKTSGSTGLHIYVPMGKKYDYDHVKEFAELLCMIVSDELPLFTTMERNLKKRGNKKIYLDYLQNRRSQTISSVYSVRPKPGATVSMPLEWKEVKKGLSPLDFTIENALKRIKKKPDLFKGILGKGVNINSCLTQLGKKYGEYIPR